MLELGKQGQAGVHKKLRPVLSDGAVVATMRVWGGSEAWVDGRHWVYELRHGPYSGRLATDADRVIRLSAVERRASWWWRAATFELEGTTLLAEPRRKKPWGFYFLREGRIVGASTGRIGWFPRPTLTLDPEFPLHQQVFVLWVLWTWMQEPVD